MRKHGPGEETGHGRREKRAATKRLRGGAVGQFAFQSSEEGIAGVDKGEQRTLVHFRQDGDLLGG